MAAPMGHELFMREGSAPTDWGSESEDAGRGDTRRAANLAHEREARDRKSDARLVARMTVDDLRDRVLHLMQAERSMKRELREKEVLLMRAAAQKQRAELASKRAVLSQLPLEEKRNFRGRVVDLEARLADAAQQLAAAEARVRRQKDLTAEAAKRASEKEARARAAEARAAAARKDLQALRSNPGKRPQYEDLARRYNDEQAESRELREQVQYLLRRWEDQGLAPPPLPPRMQELVRERNQLRVDKQRLDAELRQLRLRLGIATDDDLADNGVHLSNVGRGDEAWDLEEVFLARKHYLLDRATGMLMSAEGRWPVPVGRMKDGVLSLTWEQVHHKFFEKLDAYMGQSGASLREVFQAVDADRSGSVGIEEMRRLVAHLMPDAGRMVPEALMLMLDRDGNGQIEYQELVDGLREILATRQSVVSGTGAAEEALAKVAEFVKGNRERARQIFDELGGADDGEVSLSEAIRALVPLLRQMGRELTWVERTTLINLLLLWDADGSGTISFAEFSRAVGAAHVRYRAPAQVEQLRAERQKAEDARRATELRMQQLEKQYREKEQRWLMSDAPRPSAPAAPGLAPVDLDPAAASSVDVRGLQAKVRHLQDRYAEVQRAEQETRAKVLQVTVERDELQRLYADAKARLSKLEGEALEMRSEVEALRDYRQRCARAEHEVRELEERLRDVRGKAIAAPREARAEVEGAQAALRDTEDVNRRLRREVEVLRGEVAELRLGRGGGGGGVGGAGMGGGAGAGAGMGGGGIAGAGVGGPLAAAMAAAAGGAAVAAQRAGLAPHELQALRNEAQLLRMKLRQREVELEAAHDKLAVYLQFERRGARGLEQMGVESAARVGVDDMEKTKEQLVYELRVMRDELSRVEMEVGKLHEMLGHKDAQMAQLQRHADQLQAMHRVTVEETRAEREALSRRIDSRDEHIRRLAEKEGRYGVPGRARRVSGASDTAGLADNENVLEMEIAEASLDPSVPAPPSGTFVAVDFYRHATVVSSVGLGSNPRYGSTLQFIVEPSLDFLRHLDGAAARVDLCQPDGFGFATLGRGLLPLRKYLETALRGQATTPVTLYVDVVGADRKAVARVRVRVRMARPLPRPIVDDYVVMRQREARDAARSGGAVAEAVALAQRDPSHAAAIQFGVTYVSDLKPQGGLPYQCSPHVSYTFPGLPSGDMFSDVGRGVNTRLDDVQEVVLVRTAGVDQMLASTPLMVDVFDDSQEGPAGVLGRAQVSLADLTQGIPVDGRFPVMHPRTRQVCGTVHVFARWTDPLAPAAQATGATAVGAGATGGVAAGLAVGGSPLMGAVTSMGDAAAVRMVTQDPWVLQTSGRPRYPDDGRPRDPVFLLGPHPADWPNDDATLVICVDRVELGAELARSDRARAVAVTVGFLEEGMGRDQAARFHVSPAREREGAMVAIGHAVGYALAGGGAGVRALRGALRERMREGGGRMDVTFRLLGVRGAGEGDEELAWCKASLQDLLDGKTDVSRRVAMAGASGYSVATLGLTMRGWKALDALAKSRD